MSKLFNAGKQYGLTVRVPREIDLRRFPAFPRATKKFERLYKRRTSVERVNARPGKRAQLLLTQGPFPPRGHGQQRREPGMDGQDHAQQSEKTTAPGDVVIIGAPKDLHRLRLAVADRSRGSARHV